MLRAVLNASPMLATRAAALYVVQLNDLHAFALAARLHVQIGGVDPAELRDRALRAGCRAPMMIGAAPVERFARVLEAHDPEEGAQRARAVREMAERGAVPVLVMEADGANVTTLDALDEEAAAAVFSLQSIDDLGGWFRPMQVEA
jgi:hypothetical protein